MFTQSTLFSSAASSYRKWIIEFPLRKASLSEGLRAACAASTMLLLCYLLHEPHFSWAAIGAFLTCLADAAGSNRARLYSMGGFGLLSTIGGGLTAFAAGLGVGYGALSLMLCAGLAGFSRIYGNPTGLVMILAAGVCSIMADSPMSLAAGHHSYPAFYFLGCAWATVLGLTAWRIHPFSPARAAVNHVYESLAELAHITVGAETRKPGDDLRHLTAICRKHVRDDIALAQKRLIALPLERTGSRRLYENLLLKLARAELIQGYLTVVTDLRKSPLRQPVEIIRIDRVLRGLAGILLRMSRRIISDQAPDADVDLAAQLHRLSARLSPQLGGALALTVSSTDAGRQTAAPAPSTFRSDIRAAFKQNWQIAQLHCSGRSIEYRHGLRCATATGLAYMIVHLLHLPFGYWATMATILIIQPSIADTRARSLERAGGSVCGGLIAAVLGLCVHSSLTAALLLFPMVLATMALRPVSYGLYSLFLTPSFVLVADFAAPGSDELINAFARAGNNVIGGAIALLAVYYFWPKREASNLSLKLSEMILANLAYLHAALGNAAASSAAMHACRGHACILNLETDVLLQRLGHEGKLTDSRAQQVRTVLALSRRLAADATHIWHDPADAGLSPELVAWLDDIARLFMQTADADAAREVVALCPTAELSPVKAHVVENLKLLVATVYPVKR
ncbi:FUSC family protein [Collimonas antrihumi]|uniref:FUSC family protein n=1 Tax=Collimonas antrihumi TaxID=1940615 RepID=UPI001B8AE0BA|nr:FUSC family protein [Collimonas antrihumi]